jgi:hypothetical protein
VVSFAAERPAVGFAFDRARGLGARFAVGLVVDRVDEKATGAGATRVTFIVVFVDFTFAFGDPAPPDVTRVEGEAEARRGRGEGPGGRTVVVTASWPWTGPSSWSSASWWSTA